MIVHADALRLPLRDASVDLVVTSPPYFALRSYDGNVTGQIGEEPTSEAFVNALVDATAEMARVLKPSGSIFVNLGDKYVAKSLLGLPWRYANACTDCLGLLLRAEVIWNKPNSVPESVTDRVRRSHETWFHFTKRSRYFASMDEIREAHTGRLTTTAQPLAERDQRRAIVPNNTPHRTPGRDGLGSNPLGKLPGSVWSIPCDPFRLPAAVRIDRELPEHFAAFPPAWPARIIAGWSPPDGVVLDPFGGTGTVAMVARAMGRYGVSVDLSADYCRLAQWRVYDSGGGAKAVAKARRNGLLGTDQRLDFGGAA